MIVTKEDQKYILQVAGSWYKPNQEDGEDNVLRSDEEELGESVNA